MQPLYCQMNIDSPVSYCHLHTLLLTEMERHCKNTRCVHGNSSSPWFYTARRRTTPAARREGSDWTTTNEKMPSYCACYLKVL